MHGFAMKALQKNRSGFTLAEVLIVIAIVGVLVAVGVPMFGAQRERANIAVDQSTMRTAYSHLIAESLSGGVEADGTPYFYDLATQTFTTERPAGYGKAKTDAKDWWSGVGAAFGAPNNGTPAPLLLMMDPDGEVTFCWASSTYVGSKVSNQTDYQSLKETSDTFKEGKKVFKTELVARDKLLLDSLQATVQNMSYKDLYEMFYDENGSRKITGKSFTGNDNQDLVQSMNGKICITIAESTIDQDGNTVSEGARHNQILAEELFKAAGYDISASAQENYLIMSVSDDGKSERTNARIWLCLGVSEHELKNTLKGSEQKATKAYTYIKGAGADTASVISASGRKID